MKLVFVRHAEPDYAHDSLTAKGRVEAELLARRLCQLDVKAFYVSPLGRAKATAAYTLNRAPPGGGGDALAGRVPRPLHRL